MLRRLRLTPFIIMVIVAILLAVISIVGSASCYSSWWMSALWALLALSGCTWLIRSRSLRSPATAIIHAALLLILAGAAVTHFCSLHGTIHLRGGQVADSFTPDDTQKPRRLPFTVALTDFDIVNYPGTSTPMDFAASLLLDGETRQTVQLNHIVSHKGYRLVLASYDSDTQGLTLSVARDAAGTAVSYAGYLLFVIAAATYFCTRKTAFRRALRAASAGTLTALLTLTALPATAAGRNGTSLPSLPDYVSQKLARLPVLYNGRVAPFGTLEREFAVTVTGGDTWQGYSAEQIAEGFLFYFGDWKEEPVIKVESDAIRKIIGADNGRASYVQWFDAVTSERISTEEIATGSDARSRTDLARFEAVNSLVSGAMLRFFPLHHSDGNVQWHSPSERDMPPETDTQTWLFVRKAPGYLNECVVTSDFRRAAEVLDKIALYQRKTVPEAMPSETRLVTELFYNRVSRPFMPAGLGLLAGIVLFVAVTLRQRVPRIVTLCAVAPLWLWVTALIAMRWYVTGHVPLANGYETMTFMSWCCLTAATAVAARSCMGAVFCLTAGSLALLVAAIGGKGATVSPLMPVLGSPLLSVHVVLVMAAYSLTAIMALAAVMGLLSHGTERSRRIAAMERAMLYPAIFLMGAGIFVGAVWANMSWGRYWGWDPKEVWALVTLLTYSLAAHSRSIPAFATPRKMHLFCLLAFLSVLFTYFGVNYLLPGLHSYAAA